MIAPKTDAAKYDISFSNIEKDEEMEAIEETD
jgi:hypothetical protein